MNRFTTAILLGAACLSATAAIEKTADLPADATIEERIAIAASLVPNEQQLKWQERSLTAFLHFGMNTFTDREWGDGTEDPMLFNPSDLDTDQWVKTLKDAGFEMVILTAKHHDGFCLWPTKTTKHSVASSPWRDGKGDVVADLRRSCDKYDMKLGLYLSPWDRNAACYGDSPRYNDMFVEQLTELLTNYGTVDEVWFDGACAEGPNGKRQEYDWLRFREVMRRLQPNAVLAITGDDVRWVGNEGGVGRATEWSVTPLTPSIFPEADSVNKALGVDEMSAEIGSRELIAKASRLYWWPSEVDVSIRPGWFYHDDQQPKSLLQLAHIYLQSVGRNSVLLLNIPPDRRGLIAEADSVRLMELHNWLETSFGTDLSGRGPVEINTVSLTEDISKGQRVEQFDVVGYLDGEPSILASGTTIGKRRILTFPTARIDSVALRINETRAKPYATVEGIYAITLPVDESAPTSDGLTEIPLDKMAVTHAGNTTLIYCRLAKKAAVAGFTYTPETDSGKIFKYTVISDNKGTWTPMAPSEFGNIKAMPDARTVLFAEPVVTDCFVIRVTQTLDGPVTDNNIHLQFFEK